ncbi:MAG: Gfo/Idh/MocA family protein [Bythopirellula sp.]
MSKLRLAVVGTGHLGRIHARIAAGLENINLVAVVDPDAENRARVAGETGVAAFADSRDLFGLADAAVVATPTATHANVARELLLGGLHLLIEKPLTPTLATADELVTLARRQQLVLQVGHVERFNPGLTSLQGKIDDPKFIEARRCSGYTFRSTDIGVVLDLMIHDIDVVLNLVQSPVVQVDALGVSVLGDHEDMVNARLKFASGCVANLTASRVSDTPQRSMQIITPTCAATIDFAQRRSTLIEPSESVLAGTFDASSLSTDEKAKLSQNLFTNLLAKRDMPALDVNAIEQEQLDFVGAIRTGTNPQVTGHAGREAVAVATAILQEVAAHQWDGASGSRQGAIAGSLSPQATVALDAWSKDDTVIIHRKAG